MIRRTGVWQQQGERRKSGSPDRFEYQILTLEEPTANQLLHDSEAQGYRIRTLLSDLVVMKRPLPRPMR